jgi:HAD superfamily phosphoserine phosphatase-like hydrolase
MNYKIALFDVDGTIINGNCTQLFVQYLFEEKVVDKAYFKQYNRSLKNHSPLAEDDPKIKEEAFAIIARLGFEDLKRTWNKCFTTRIKHRFNEFVVRKIKFFQSRGIEVILASRSPEILIREVANTLNIPTDNIIAAKIQELNSGLSFKHCIGYEKESAVLNLINKRGINIDEVCFVTDNLSDLNLLYKVGQGYWAGSESKFESSSMSKQGIEQFLPGTKFTALNNESNVLLDEYYFVKKSIIEESIKRNFPLKCNQQILDSIVGKGFAHWDLPTLQRSYFDPINEYLENYNNRIITLGTCIFLEAGGVKLKDHILFLTIGELLNLSNEVFVDISNWTSEENLHRCEKSQAEISILGNASISLLSMPIHTVLQNKPGLNSDIKWQLYEMYTSIVYYSLFGNGIKLHWERQVENHLSIEDYIKVAILVNRGSLEITSNLFLILSNQATNVHLKNKFGDLSRNAAVLIQLIRDQIAFDDWQKEISPDRKYAFNLFINFMCIHACQFKSDPKLFNRNQSIAEVKDIILSTNSINYLEKKIEFYKSKVDLAIDSLPFSRKHKVLVNEYVNQLVHL